MTKIVPEQAARVAGCEPSLAADRLRGITAIAAFIGETRRRTFYLAERGYLPLAKEGRQWIASRQALREHYARLTGCGVA